jgi:hypothetical protein
VENNESKAEAVESRIELRSYLKQLQKVLRSLWEDLKIESCKARFWVEVVALLGILAYTTVTAFQYREMAKATKATEQAARAAVSAAATADATLKAEQKRFRMEQRPYIWAAPRAGNSAGIAIGSPRNDGVYVVDVAVEIKNGGRSPAIHVLSSKSEIIIGPRDEAIKAAKDFVPQYDQSAGVTLSMDTAHTVATESCLSALQRYFGTDITRVPFKCVSQYSGPTLTGKLIDNLVDGSWDVFIVGAVSYSDMLQPPLEQPYETSYCFHVQPKGLPFGNCKFGNAMK